MSASWAMAKDEGTGQILSGEHVGFIRGEPDFRLTANRYAWSVSILGVEAKAGILQDMDIDRASRKRGVDVDRVDFAKERAEAWAKNVIQKRDQDE